jgi:chitinase
MLSAESLWVVGYNGTTDTVLAAHLENINTSSRTIVSTQKKYKLGTHYYWSSAKDTAASQNYFKSVVYSFRVDTATAVSKSNLVAITYLEYWSASFPNPTIYGQIDWDVITHAIYHQGNPSQTVNPDPLYPEIKYWAAGNGTIASFEIDNGQPRVRQAIDSAHAHGRKVILGLGGTSGTGTNWDWMSANNHMKEFVHGISWYCKSRGFDGVDLDWEYPGNGSVYGVTEISAAYDLIRTLRDTLNSAAAGWSTPGIITWAAQPWSSQWYLHPDSVLKWVNYINIMNYDYADYGTSYNAHHTALYPYNVAGIPTYESNNNVISVQDSLYTTASPRNGWGPISYYPKNRVTVGLGFYGHGRGGNALGGLGGSFGFERFGSCTQGMYNTPATAYRYHYDTVAQSPYLAWTDASAPGCGFAATVHFHTFDDTTSIQVKAAWARNNGYAGVMIFDAPGDNSTFDLQRAVKKAFAGAIAIVPPDTIPPVVSITRIGGVVPFGQMTVQGSVLIEISAQDNTSIDVVSFQVDGNWQILTTQTFPYTYLWNTVGLTPGSHTIQARATDPRGNIGYSAPFTLTVQAVVATRIPSIPQLLTPTQAQSISTTSVNLTIADSSCATTCDVVTTYTYEVRIGSSTGAIFTTDASGNNLVKALSGLANGVTYFWRVGATNTVGTVYSQYRNFSVSAAAIAKTYSSFSKWDPINHWWSSMSQPPGYSVMTKTSLSSLVGVLGTSDTNVVIWNQYGTLDNLGNTIPSTQGLITSPQTISALWTFNAGVSTTNLTTAGNVSALTANIGTLTTTNRFANIVFNTVLPLRWNATTNTLTVDSASTTQPGALGAYSYSVFATGVPTSPDTTHKIRTFEDFIYIGGSHINYNSAIVAGDNAYWIPSMSLFGIGSPTVVSGIAVSVVSMLPAVSDSGRIGLIKIDVDSLASGTQNGTLCKGGMLFAYTGSSGSREIINPIKNGNEFTISVKFGTVNDSMAWYAGFFSENYFQNDYTDPALIQNNAISFEYRKIASGAAGDSVYGCTQAGNSKTRTGLFVPVFNGATWNKLTFRSRGTSVDFYVNGVYKKTITTNLPGTTAAVSRGIGMLGYDNAVIGSGKQVIIDYDEFLNNGVIR